VAITDESIGVSQLLGTCAWAAPKVYTYANLFQFPNSMFTQFHCHEALDVISQNVFKTHALE